MLTSSSDGERSADNRKVERTVRQCRGPEGLRSEQSMEGRKENLLEEIPILNLSLFFFSSCRSHIRIPAAFELHCTVL
ncbi:hypothetical protein VTN96DRAFT_7648 [Rasamsonia emersonii]